MPSGDTPTIQGGMAMKVRVTKAPTDKYWYSKHIGEIIEVKDELDFDGHYDVVDWQRYRDDNKGVCGKYIEFGDCEVIKKAEVSVADTWLLVRNDRGTVIGHYDQLRYAKQRRTSLKPLGTTIVKVSAVEGCEDY